MIDHNRIKKFLESQKGKWHKWNVPFADGQSLYDLAMAHKVKNILEIGTSYGHSTIWLAWAAAQNNGQVMTVEIDHRVMEDARRNFKIAGVLPYILQCQTDAKRFIPYLKGSFDMVFSDGDRSSYIQVFNMIEPLLSENGIIVTHNVASNGGPKLLEYLSFLENHPRFSTHFIHSSPEGIAVSQRKQQLGK